MALNLEGFVMAFRTSWKGYLKLSLISVPVKSYSAVSSQDGEIHFHQLHEKCHSRIKYVKTCPLHGAVPTDEIVSGYEYSKGEYVVMEPGELDALRSEREKSVNLEVIVPDAAIDRLYLSDRISYLVPDGRVGEKPYAVIARCLSDEGHVAIGRLVNNGKDEVVMIRSLDNLLVMTVLSSAAQVKNPKLFDDEKPSASATAAELKMTKTLLQAFYQEEVDLAEYKDHYNERVAELINAKISGREIVAPAPSDQPDVINLMDALKKSLAQTKSSGSTKSTSAAKATPKATNKTSSASAKADNKTALLKSAIARSKSPAKKKSKSA